MNMEEEYVGVCLTNAELASRGHPPQLAGAEAESARSSATIDEDVSEVIAGDDVWERKNGVWRLYGNIYSLDHIVERLTRLGYKCEIGVHAEGLPKSHSRNEVRAGEFSVHHGYHNNGPPSTGLCDTILVGASGWPRKIAINWQGMHRYLHEGGF